MQDVRHERVALLGSIRLNKLGWPAFEHATFPTNEEGKISTVKTQLKQVKSVKGSSELVCLCVCVCEFQLIRCDIARV